jgi:hypothetical protein
MSYHHWNIYAQYITYMTWNTSYYMNSYITLEHTDHEVLVVVKYIAEALQKTPLMLQGPASSPKMRSPRSFFRAWAPSWLFSPPVGRHWATRAYHSTRSTRAYLQAKRSTSKTWATKAQQDWPVNIAINNRLLICKFSWKSSILM